MVTIKYISNPSAKEEGCFKVGLYRAIYINGIRQGKPRYIPMPELHKDTEIFDAVAKDDAQRHKRAMFFRKLRISLESMLDLITLGGYSKKILFK